jgi:hypothetical protein
MQNLKFGKIVFKISKIKSNITKDLPDTNDIVKCTLESEPLAQPKLSTMVMPASEEKVEKKESVKESEKEE